MNDHDDAPDPTSWAWPEDDEDATSPRSRRRWLLLAAAAVPWVVVTALLLRPSTSDGAAPLAPAPAPSTEDVADRAPAPSPRPSARASGATPRAHTLRSGARHTVDVGDAVTTAVLVARAWFNGAGPHAPPAHPTLAGDRAGYVEHVWVEAVDAPWRGQVVVVLGLLVLERDGDELVPTARRLAVPVHLDRTGTRAAGAPYALPAPTVEVRPLSREPVDDPERALAATDALTRAGYAVDEVTELARSDGWPWTATFVGSAPDGSPATTHRVWLRPHLGGFVVAGWLPDARPPDDPEQEEVAP